MIGRLLALAAGLAGLGACGSTTDTPVSQLNLDRPVDIAFACYGGLRLTNGGSASTTQQVVTSAMPTTACDFRSTPRSISDPTPIPTGQEDLTGSGGAALAGVSWYGFILQSVPGTVALARFDTKPSTSFTGGDVAVLDADPLTPGENGITVGEDPVAIATDQVGCYEMVANAGSCDLSALDITSALDGTSGAKVDRLAVKSSTGMPLRSKPAAMIGEPAAGTIGVACPAQPTGLVYIAYPSCHAVAVVDVSTGMAVSSIRFDATGAATIGDGNLSCPDECGGGGVATAGTRPVSIDMFVDPRVHTTRMLIGADNLAAFTVVEIGADFLPASLRQIPLENTTGTLGISQVALSPQIGMGGASGIVSDIGPQFQFAYGVASDNTVRVADILSVFQECDTQVDPRLLNTQHNVATLSCLPVGDPATPRRRPLARGPGVELPGLQVPVSVAIFKADNFAGDTRLQAPDTLKGYFGAITAANGSTYVLNVDDDNYGDSVAAAQPLTTQIPLAIANQLRDGIANRDQLATTGSAASCNTEGPDPDTVTTNTDGPREHAPPVANNTSGFVATNKIGELPSIRQVQCVGADATRPVTELSFAAPVQVRANTFPDLRSLHYDESWTLTWEGSLSLDSQSTAADGPAIRTGMLAVQASDGMTLVDQTDPFCNAGVETDDIVQLRGCDPSLGDTQCPLGYTCFVHPDSKVSGLGACMLTDEASRLADACKEFLVSLRRYAVGRAKSGALILIPRTHVLTTTPVDGCTSDAQCQSLADYALREPSSADPVNDTTAKDSHTWACRADATRKPIGGTGNRCVESCTKDADCDTGAVCLGGTCMEGAIPPQACVNAPQRYDLRASDAFTVVGTTSGYIHPIIADSGGSCVRDPNASPFEIGRIALAPPACDPTADPLTGLKADGTYDANPCLVSTTEYEFEPQFVAGTCTLANPSSALVTRPTNAIRFHGPGMTLDLVDPTYPGDSKCVQDRAGSPLLGGSTSVPLVYPGYQIGFRQVAGFSPLTMSVSAAFPVKVVRGPTNSIWVIDDGDFLSTDVTVPSTSGKVFRVEPENIGTVNLLE